MLRLIDPAGIDAVVHVRVYRRLAHHVQQQARSSWDADSRRLARLMGQRPQHGVVDVPPELWDELAWWALDLHKHSTDPQDHRAATVALRDLRDGHPLTGQERILSNQPVWVR